jgi:hypothetical protein
VTEVTGYLDSLVNCKNSLVNCKNSLVNCKKRLVTAFLRVVLRGRGVDAPSARGEETALNITSRTQDGQLGFAAD